MKLCANLHVKKAFLVTVFGILVDKTICA